MKRIYQIFILIMLLSLSIFAQANLQLNKYENLSEEIISAKSTKEIKEVASKAEDIYKKSKKQFRNNPEELAKTTMDFALFRQNIFQVLNKALTNPKLLKSEGLNFLDLYKDNAEELENLLEETIKIYENNLKTENTQLATAKFELAKSIESYKLLREDSSNWNKHLEKLNKVQNLYLDAFVLREKLLGENDDLILIAAYYVANSYLQSGDFEKALPFFEKYIAGVEEKYGQKSVDLLPALRTSAAIWRMIGRDEAVEKITGQISEITNEKEDLSEGFLPLSARSKSFKHDGINNTLGQFSSSKPYGITGDGRTAAADIDSINSIRGRPESQPPNFKFIVPGGNSKFKSAKVIKTVITIDTEGNVSDAAAEINDSKIKEKVEKEVKKWEFKPFVYEGKAMEMKGVIYYYYLD